MRNNINVIRRLLRNQNILAFLLFSLSSLVVASQSVVVPHVDAHDGEVPGREVGGSNNLRRRIYGRATGIKNGSTTATINDEHHESESNEDNNENSLSIEEQNQNYFDHLVQRMKPHFLEIQNNQTSSYLSSPPKQFFHLHHMKTGGTSLSSFIRCGIHRYTDLYNKHNQIQDSASTHQHLNIPTYSISECSFSSYHSCVSNPENRCHSQISQATQMNFCAPLAITNHLQWNNDAYNTPSVTMMRNPIDRVWSMYRFQTKSCFKCKSLIEIYNDMDNNNTTQYGGGVCLAQLSNHLTRNLLTNLTIDELNNDNSSMTDEEKVQDAITSIKHRFTVVGVIERLEESIEMFSYSFPWLSEDIGFSGYYKDWEDDGMKCTYPHSNSSPRHNGCGKDNTHLDLPPHPDEETKRVIEEHNRMDMKVYEAALEHFEIQKQAMDWEEDEELD